MFKKLERLGFGGRGLSLIESMYTKDSLLFLVNGKFTDELFLTKGVLLFLKLMLKTPNFP